MKCLHCSKGTKVLETRDKKIRVRVCTSGHRFKTKEIYLDHDEPKNNTPTIAKLATPCKNRMDAA